MSSCKNLEKLDASIKRWKTRAKRAHNALEKLERARERLVRRIAIKPHPKLVPLAPQALVDLITNPPVPSATVALAPGTHSSVDLPDIPEFLKRPAMTRTQKDIDDARRVLEEVEAAKAEKAEKAAERRKIKKEIIEADLRGLTRKMPLQGRAALEALKG